MRGWHGPDRPNYTSHLDSNDHMPFGKYENWRITDIPLSYLRWCSENFETSDLLDDIETEIYRRKKKMGPETCRANYW